MSAGGILQGGIDAGKEGDRWNPEISHPPALLGKCGDGVPSPTPGMEATGSGLPFPGADKERLDQILGAQDRFSDRDRMDGVPRLRRILRPGSIPAVFAMNGIFIQSGF